MAHGGVENMRSACHKTGGSAVLKQVNAPVPGYSVDFGTFHYLSSEKVKTEESFREKFSLKKKRRSDSREANDFFPVCNFIS